MRRDRREQTCMCLVCSEISKQLDVAEIMGTRSHMKLKEIWRLVVDMWIMTSSIKGCSNKVPPPGWVRQEKFVVSQSWRLEVQNQDVGRATLPPQCLGEFLFLTFPVSGSSPRTSQHQSPPSSPHGLPPSVSVSKFLLIGKTPVILDLGLILLLYDFILTHLT